MPRKDQKDRSDRSVSRVTETQDSLSRLCVGISSGKPRVWHCSSPSTLSDIVLFLLQFSSYAWEWCLLFYCTPYDIEKEARNSRNIIQFSIIFVVSTTKMSQANCKLRLMNSGNRSLRNLPPILYPLNYMMMVHKINHSKRKKSRRTKSNAVAKRMRRSRSIGGGGNDRESALAELDSRLEIAGRTVNRLAWQLEEMERVGATTAEVARTRSEFEQMERRVRELLSRREEIARS